MLWIKIINDRTGDANTGNYVVIAGINERELSRTTVAGYNRNNGWHWLTQKAAEALVEKETERIMSELAALGQALERE